MGGQRGVDEWVLFRNDQILTCFLVDKLGVIAAKEALHAAIRLIHQPWPSAEVSMTSCEVAEVSVETEPSALVDGLIFQKSVEAERDATCTRWNRRGRHLRAKCPDNA